VSFKKESDEVKKSCKASKDFHKHKDAVQKFRETEYDHEKAKTDLKERQKEKEILESNNPQPIENNSQPAELGDTDSTIVKSQEPENNSSALSLNLDNTSNPQPNTTIENQKIQLSTPVEQKNTEASTGRDNFSDPQRQDANINPSLDSTNIQP